MENHPIPQDVTGFKFRLIGSITLKQFLYLLGAGGIGLAVWFLPMALFVKIPIILVAGSIGMAFAFIPIDGRPMDKMLMNFAKALPAENQYLYHKVGDPMIFFSFVPSPHAVSAASTVQNQEAASKAALFSQLSKSYFQPDPEEQQNLASISQLFQEGQPAAQGFTNRVIKADTPPSVPARPTAPTTIPTQAAPLPHTPVAEQKTQNVQAAQVPGLQTQQPAQTVAQASSTSAYGMDTPNVLQGIVVDPRKKPLPHVIVEVLDQNNIPVRTFRTNQSGGFAAATPLPNGEYTIHLEDSMKKQNFTDVKLTLSGTILEPLTIASVDQREQLRRELFGGGIQNG